jgi:hypothetical protein
MPGMTVAPFPVGEFIMSRFWNAALIGVGLLVPLAVAPTALRAQDNKNARTYHDKKGNDDHQWNDHENQAYQVYVKDNHRKNTNFSKLKDSDQQAYWGWRHQHSDEVLKINIR